MKTTFYIDGGAGRVLSSIPALIRYSEENPHDDFTIISPYGDFFYWGIEPLQDRAFNTETNGLFKKIQQSTDIISPEPYRLPEYINQKVSIIEAFDILINGNLTVENRPYIRLNKQEDLFGYTTIKSFNNNNKTIIIQPFGSTAKLNGGEIIDEETRSIPKSLYIRLVEKLKDHFNIIFMGEEYCYVDTCDTKLSAVHLREWAGILKYADYFIGCDSVGQHIARALDKPGTVILGSTFAVNTSYPNHFNIYQKYTPNYVPIRISNFESLQANRHNDNILDLTSLEIQKLTESILRHINENTWN